MAQTKKALTTCEDAQPLNECSICLEETSGRVYYAYVENCGHFFHELCLVKWFNEGMNSCPLCRAHFSRILLWPKTIESQDKKSIIFELQKQCFGLFNVSPQTDICVTHPGDMVSVEINEANLQLMCTTEDGNSTYEPATELGMPDLEEFELQFRMEVCDHVFPCGELKSQLAQLRRTRKVACSTCGTESMHLLLEPEFTYFGNINIKKALFYNQKLCFGKDVENHNLVIEELSNEQFLIRIDGWQHFLTTDSLTNTVISK